MAYTKTNWVNGQTPINADNLNKMEKGIKDAHDFNDAATNIVKLWENASPTSSFEPQDLDSNVLVDLPKNYDIIKIVFLMVVGSYEKSVTVPIYNAANTGFIMDALYGASSKIIGRYRGGVIYPEKINFKTGYSTSPSTDAADNTCAIPKKIYGIKGVK